MYTAKIWVTDERPEQPEKAKPEDKPEGGYRTKSGRRQLGKTIQGEDPSGVLATVAEIVASKPEEKRTQIERVTVEKSAAVQAGEIDW